MHDTPIVKISVRPARLLFTKSLLLIVLGGLLYLGIYVNYSVLSKTMPAYLNILFMASIVIILVLETFLSYLRYRRYEYIFYTDRLETHIARIKTISYTHILKISVKKNLVDDMFNTCQVVLELDKSSGKKRLILEGLDDSNETYFHMQKIITGKHKK